jgi:hypothetical protein
VYAGCFALFLAGLVAAVPAQASEPADCPNLTQVIKEINVALYAAEIDQAASLAASAEDALLCQTEPINPLVLFQVFQYAGAVQIFQGDEGAAKEAFETAVAVAPGQNLDPILGSDAEEAFQRVREEVLKRPPGSLQAHFDGEAWIDGHRAVTGGTVDLSPGAHLFQWQVHGEPLKARLLHVTGAETRKIAFGEAAEARLEAAVAAANAPVVTEPVALHGLRTPLLASGGGLLAAGAGLMVVARIKFGDFNSLTFETESDLTPEEQLSQKRDVTNTYAVLGLGSAALGAGLLGVGVLVGDAPGITVRGQW